MEERNVGAKGKRPKQGQASAKVITLILLGGRETLIIKLVYSTHFFPHVYPCG